MWGNLFPILGPAGSTPRQKCLPALKEKEKKTADNLLQLRFRHLADARIQSDLQVRDQE